MSTPVVELKLSCILSGLLLVCCSGTLAAWRPTEYLPTFGESAHAMLRAHRLMVNLQREKALTGQYSMLETETEMDIFTVAVPGTHNYRSRTNRPQPAAFNRYTVRESVYTAGFELASKAIMLSTVDPSALLAKSYTDAWQDTQALLECVQGNLDNGKIANAFFQQLMRAEPLVQSSVMDAASTGWVVMLTMLGVLAVLLIMLFLPLIRRVHQHHDIVMILLLRVPPNIMQLLAHQRRKLVTSVSQWAPVRHDVTPFCAESVAGC